MSSSMKSYFEESNISWAKDLCEGLKVYELVDYLIFFIFNYIFISLLAY